MLCPALAKTRDPRVATVLIDLIDDDFVNGHAVLELRRLGRWKGLPQAERAKPKLEQLIERPDAGEFAKKQAKVALASLTHTQWRRGNLAARVAIARTHASEIARRAPVLQQQLPPRERARRGWQSAEIARPSLEASP